VIDTPQIITTIEHHTAVIRLTIPRAEIQSVMGPAIQEVMAVVGAQRLRMAGPVLSYHHRIDPAVFDLEVGVPVAGTVRGEGRVVPSRLPALRAARTIYRGPYEGLGAAWGEFSAWVGSQHRATRGEVWESYLKGPESGAEPSRWETELVKPLR
jgi:effector-binding domain-containing protein